MERTLELARRISVEENIIFEVPQFFPLSIDHAMACIDVHWLSRKAEDGVFCFHMKHLVKYLLGAKGLKVVYNIFEYGVRERLKKVCEKIDMYAQKAMQTVIIEKGNLASNSPSEEQQQQSQPREKKNAHSLANQQ